MVSFVCGRCSSRRGRIVGGKGGCLRVRCRVGDLLLDVQVVVILLGLPCREFRLELLLVVLDPLSDVLDGKVIFDGWQLHEDVEVFCNSEWVQVPKLSHRLVFTAPDMHNFFDVEALD